MRIGTHVAINNIVKMNGYALQRGVSHLIDTAKVSRLNSENMMVLFSKKHARELGLDIMKGGNFEGLPYVTLFGTNKTIIVCNGFTPPKQPKVPVFEPVNEDKQLSRIKKSGLKTLKANPLKDSKINAFIAETEGKSTSVEAAYDKAGLSAKRPTNKKLAKRFDAARRRLKNKGLL